MSRAQINGVFQSPCGVSGVCRTRDRFGNYTLIKKVSVPFRGFRGLQDVLVAKRAKVWSSTFQSPSGVLGVCRWPNMHLYAMGVLMFQSPCGVLGVCRVMMIIAALILALGSFSPLAGF